MKGVQFGGRVRVRVRVRVSQGCRRFAKGEGKGAGNSINPFSRRAISRKTSGAVPRTTLDAFVRARGCGVPSFHPELVAPVAVFEP